MNRCMRLEASTIPGGRCIDMVSLWQRFPEMTLGDLSDILWTFGIEVKFRAVEIDPFLWDAWKCKAKRERTG